MWRANSLEKTRMLGKFKGKKRRGWQGWDGWMASMTYRHEFEQTPGDSEGQGSLACCSSWSCKESDMTEKLTNWDSSGNFIVNNLILECFPYYSLFIPVETESHQIPTSLLKGKCHRPWGWIGLEVRAVVKCNSLLCSFLLYWRGKMNGGRIPFQDHVCCHTS